MIPRRKKMFNIYGPVQVFTLVLVNWRLARVILSLKAKENYLGKILENLETTTFKVWEDQEYNGMLNIQPDVKSLITSNATETDISYLAQHCPGIEELDIFLKQGTCIKLEGGFVNLAVLKLDLNLDYLEPYRLRGSILSLALKHVTVLPNLKVLQLKLYSEQVIVHQSNPELDGDHQWSKMEKLESLETDFKSSMGPIEKLLNCCPAAILTNIRLSREVDDEMITFVCQNLPNLKSVGLVGPLVTAEAWSLFVQTYGNQVRGVY